MPFQSIEPRRLYRQIADQIRALIRSGEFPAGARLPPERDLAKQLGVSRPSVREALIALEVEGLVEVRIGSGIYVLAPAGAGDVPAAHGATAGPFELLRARYVIESECAALAAKSARKAQVRRSRRRSTRWSASATGGSRSPATGCSTCGSPRRPATARSSGGQDAVGRAHGPALQAARASLRFARVWDGGDGRASLGAARRSPTTTAGARAAMQRHLNQAYKRFSRVGYAASEAVEHYGRPLGSP